MINKVRYPTPPQPPTTYHPKMSYFSARNTLSTPPGEESGAPKWSELEPQRPNPTGPQRPKLS